MAQALDLESHAPFPWSTSGSWHTRVLTPPRSSADTPWPALGSYKIPSWSFRLNGQTHGHPCPECSLIPAAWALDTPPPSKGTQSGLPPSNPKSLRGWGAFLHWGCWQDQFRLSPGPAACLERTGCLGLEVHARITPTSLTAPTGTQTPRSPFSFLPLPWSQWGSFECFFSSSSLVFGFGLFMLFPKVSDIPDRPVTPWCHFAHLRHPLTWPPGQIGKMCPDREQ